MLNIIWWVLVIFIILLLIYGWQRLKKVEADVKLFFSSNGDIMTRLRQLESDIKRDLNS